MTPADLLELPLEDPVLGGLQVHLRVALADDLVAEHLADRVPGGQLRLHSVRELDELEAVDDLLARGDVAGVPGEVALHVREPEEGLGPHVVEPRHSGEADLQRDRDVALDLFGAPSVGLGDDLDQRGDRVRVRLDVEVAVGAESPENDDDRHRQDDERHSQSQCHESLDHGRAFSAGPDRAPRRNVGDLPAGIEANFRGSERAIHSVREAKEMKPSRRDLARG